MRLRRIRLGLRLGTLIATVAAFALGITAERMRARWSYCWDRAGYFASLERQSREQLERYEAFFSTVERRRARYEESGDRRWAEGQVHQMRLIRQEMRAEGFQARRAAQERVKFERAALNPWMPTPPDPYLGHHVMKANRSISGL